MTDACACLFAAEPLDRCSDERADPAWIEARYKDPKSRFLPLYKGDPLVRNGEAVFLAPDARHEFPANARIVFLGVADGAAHFAIDASGASSADSAPMADLGRYTPLREAAGEIGEDDLAIIAEARWLLDWHRRHRFCAHCGAKTTMAEGGAKRQCPECSTEHFPRSDPVAIVLATHDDACLLGRSPRFPAKFFSALAGYVEASETPEACAVRELREEAGVVLSNVRYLFSQPWPFPSSLMMGFLADTQSRALTLDQKEIEEARWVERGEIRAILAGEARSDLFLPPRFTIARRLIEEWAGETA